MTHQNNDDQRLKQLVANWINGTNTFEDVQYLENSVRKKLRDASKSILRKFYSIVLQTKVHIISSEKNEEKITNEVLTSLYRTYIMSKYELGRSKKNNKDVGDKGLRWLSQIMEYGIVEMERISKVTTEVATLNRAFQNFTKIMEAIVAFHKLYGEKK